MEQFLNLKVDLEHPEDAKFAIDAAAKVYEEDKRKWTAQEIADAKHLALRIMNQLCLYGYSIQWGCEAVNKEHGAISVWVSDPNLETMNSFQGDCIIDGSAWNTWIGKCIALHKATRKRVPEFITKKVGEC
mgnify:CR=1 FL=1